MSEEKKVLKICNLSKRNFVNIKRKSISDERFNTARTALESENFIFRKIRLKNTVPCILTARPSRPAINEYVNKKKENVIINSLSQIYHQKLE